MKKGLLSLFACTLATFGMAQLTSSADTTVCNNGSANLVATANTTGVLFNGLQTVSLSDDIHSGVVNIGFPFTFYGNSYTQCVIASNNYITFDLNLASAYSPYSINNAIPNPVLPTNAIMCPYQDINPGVGGSVEYGTIGTAPNRIFVVRYFQVPMFSCTQLQFCSAVFLFEGSNRIETHIENKPLCSTWNGGAAIHGTHNSTGSLADIVPGRNYPTQWTTALEGMEFVPNGANAYTINTIPFQAVVSNNNIEWFNGTTLVGTGTTISVNPTVDTDYEARLTFCDGSTWSDTTTVFIAPDLTFNNTVTPTACSFNSGTGDIVTTGGSGNYTYSWSPGGFTTNSATGLGMGAYTVLVTDVITGCATNNILNIVENNTVDVNPVTINPTACNGTSTGNATVQGANGVGAYTYQWDANTNSQTGPMVNNLGAGTYQVVITDADGCQDSTSVTITEPSNISTVISGIGATSCFGGSDGTANVIATGGNGMYSYSWNDPSNTTVGNNSSLPAGVWVVTVTDSAGCSTTDTATIGEPAALLSSVVSTTNVGCFGSADGTGEVVGSGGTSPYTYDWVGLGVFSADAYNLPAGTFDVIITDANGCSITQQVVITEPAPAQVSATGTLATCGSADGTATVVPNGGQSPYSYQWNAAAGSQTTATATNLGAGTYTCTVTDGNGCTTQATVTVTDVLDIAASFVPNPGEGVATLNVDFTNTTTGSPVGYSWDFGNGSTSTSTNPSTIYTTPGTYIVTLVVTNAGGCTSTYFTTITVKEESTLTAPNVFTPNNDGYNDEWLVQYEAIVTFECIIYDRWGKEVYKYNNPAESWDGGDQNEGTYFYTITALGDDDKEYGLSGNITLTR